MTRRKTGSQVVISKKELLLPRMEFLPLEENGAGFFVKELGGKALLEYKELVQQAEKESGGELTDLQSIEMMAELVYRTACNANGSPYFESEEEVELFVNKSLRQLQIVADKAMELAGMGAKNNLKNEMNSSSTDS